MEINIIDALLDNNKTPDDVSFVIYVGGADRVFYSCSIESFFKVIKNVKYELDLQWLYDIKIVGRQFWLKYTSNKNWMFYQIPKRPPNFKIPEEDDVVRRNSI